MNVLGISFDYHDAAAALLVVNGRIVAAAAEERFSRRKHDFRFPESAISFCLKKGGIQAKDIDAVAFYEKTLDKFNRIVHSAIHLPSGETGYLEKVVKHWIRWNKFDPLLKISEFLAIPEQNISSIEHHKAHAASAFYCSPFDKATIITIDGVGESETMTVSAGEDFRIERIYANSLPHSLGLLYSAITSFLGFEINEGEYKVMGLSAYGTPTYLDFFRGMIDLLPDGRFTVKQDFFEFLRPEDLPYNSKLVELLGSPRNPDNDLSSAISIASGDGKKSIEHDERRYADIACSLQRSVEEAILHIVKNAINRTGIKRVCMAGGVALNSLANGMLQKKLDCPLYVQPAAGDSGGALGAALYLSHGVYGGSRKIPLTNAYLGEEYTAEQIEDALDEYGILARVCFPNDDKLVEDIVEKLASGDVIGWMQGRFEWGPRALGNRSILATPIHADMKEIVNGKIKFREPFRPFAPSVLAECADDFFDLQNQRTLSSPEYYMLSVCTVKPHKRHLIPAVVHVDGTARVHLVDRLVNPLYYQLIHAFFIRTGIPILLNTSFNLAGEPIVNNPYDALKTFSWSDMDYLVMGRYVITKEPTL